MAGWNVMVGLDGGRDERSYVGEGGTLVPWLAELPEDDNGEPDVQKDYGRIEMYLGRAQANLNVGILLDNGLSVAVPVSLSFSASRWTGLGDTPDSDTMIWNQSKWARSKPGKITAPIPAGSIGARQTTRLTGDLEGDELVLLGVTLDFTRLPDRPFS